MIITFVAVPMVLPGNEVNENKLSTEEARGTEAGEVNTDEAGDALEASPPEANEDNGPQQKPTAPSEHRSENSTTSETATAALEGVSNGSFMNAEAEEKSRTSSGNCGGGRDCPVSNRDSDFDCLLADYVNGPFGEAGGGLLIPLGGLRLLR